MKRFCLFLPLVLAAAGLLLYPEISAQAARDALALCAQVIIPSLFPFFVLSSLIISTGGAEIFASLLGGSMPLLFGLSSAGASAFVLGLVGGYPVGARTVGELYARGTLARRHAERLLGFCNNAGPGFILGICGSAVFHSARVGVYLYLVHIAAALFSGMLLCRDLPRRGRAERNVPCAQKDAPFASLFSAAVQSALGGILNVCAFVVLFMVLLRLIASVLPASFAALPLYPLLLGCVEMTNGITLLSSSRIGFVFCAVLLGWGGLSVHAQTLSVLGDSDLSTRYYWRGKIMQAALSAPLAYLVSFLLF